MRSVVIRLLLSLVTVLPSALRTSRCLLAPRTVSRDPPTRVVLLARRASRYYRVVPLKWFVGDWTTNTLRTIASWPTKNLFGCEHQVVNSLFGGMYADRISTITTPPAVVVSPPDPINGPYDVVNLAGIAAVICVSLVCHVLVPLVPPNPSVSPAAGIVAVSMAVKMAKFEPVGEVATPVVSPVVTVRNHTMRHAGTLLLLSYVTTGGSAGVGSVVGGPLVTLRSLAEKVVTGTTVSLSAVTITVPTVTHPTHPS